MASVGSFQPVRPVGDPSGSGIATEHAAEFDIHLDFDPEGVNLGKRRLGIHDRFGKVGWHSANNHALQQQLGLKLQWQKELNGRVR